MRIIPVANKANYKNYTSKKEDNAKNSCLSSQNSMAYSNFNYEPSFTSTSIYIQYRKLQGKMPERVEKLMRENLLVVKNPKLVYDVHNEAYAALGKCETLAQIKELFPEFAQVKSTPAFDDTALQFIEKKIAKGEGPASLEDFVVRAIKNMYFTYRGSRDSIAWFGFSRAIIARAIDELEIPKLEHAYINTLRHSTPESRKGSGERLNELIEANPNHQKEAASAVTKEVGQKISKSTKWTKRLNPQYAQITKDYFADESVKKTHGKKVSDGLKRYYEENPERRVEISKQMKKYCSDPENIKKRNEARKARKKDN